jgi:hypothetical protein
MNETTEREAMLESMRLPFTGYKKEKVIAASEVK